MDHVLQIERWIADLGPAGPALLIGLLVVGTSILIPEALFAIAAGALFGLDRGFLIVVVGNLLAASVQYGLARSFLHDRIQRSLASRPQLMAIQRAVLRDELRLQLLLRLTPLNAASLSYVFAAAGVRFASFLFACIGMAPHLLIEVYLGHAGQHLTRMSAGVAHHHSMAQKAITIGGLVISAAVVLIISRIARKSIQQVLPPPH
jgi:uncharacterized membrane protein YdjX (TVP38/TMEM64 family)